MFYRKVHRGFHAENTKAKLLILRLSGFVAVLYRKVRQSCQTFYPAKKPSSKEKGLSVFFDD